VFVEDSAAFHRKLSVPKSRKSATKSVTSSSSSQRISTPPPPRWDSTSSSWDSKSSGWDSRHSVQCTAARYQSLEVVRNAPAPCLTQNRHEIPKCNSFTHVQRKLKQKLHLMLCYWFITANKKRLFLKISGKNSQNLLQIAIKYQNFAEQNMSVAVKLRFLIIGVGAGGQGIGPPTFSTGGIIPHFLL